MRVAPPVQAPSCAAGPWRTVQQTLYAVSTTVALLWAGGHGPAATPWLVPGALGLGLVAGVLAGRCLSSATFQLIWDGATWSVQPPHGERCTGQAELMLDLGPWMLLRFVPDSATASRRALWLPLRHADAAQVWRALRVALLAPRAQSRAAQPLAEPRRAA